MAVKKKEYRPHYTVYLPADLAELMEKLEQVWTFRSRQDFFESAVRDGLFTEIGKCGKALEKRVGKAVLSHIRAIDDI